jgi:hypothetical protein
VVEHHLPHGVRRRAEAAAFDAIFAFLGERGLLREGR